MDLQVLDELRHASNDPNFTPGARKHMLHALECKVGAIVSQLPPGHAMAESLENLLKEAGGKGPVPSTLIAAPAMPPQAAVAQTYDQNAISPPPLPRRPALEGNQPSLF